MGFCRLDRMRASPRYNWYTTRAGVEELVARCSIDIYVSPYSTDTVPRYGYTMFLAEQDWLTNLGWTEPDLFYNLPCTFNRQTSIRDGSIILLLISLWFSFIH